MAAPWCWIVRNSDWMAVKLPRIFNFDQFGRKLRDDEDNPIYMGGGGDAKSVATS